MATTGKPDKSKIKQEFETMKSLELSAADLYTRIAESDQIDQPKVSSAFASIAKDEHRHAQLVDKIINLVNNTL